MMWILPFFAQIISSNISKLLSPSCQNTEYCSTWLWRAVRSKNPYLRVIPPPRIKYRVLSHTHSRNSVRHFDFLIKSLQVYFWPGFSHFKPMSDVSEKPALSTIRIHLPSWRRRTFPETSVDIYKTRMVSQIRIHIHMTSVGIMSKATLCILCLLDRASSW